VHFNSVVSIFQKRNVSTIASFFACFLVLVKAPLKHHPSYLDSLYSSIVFSFSPIAKPFHSFTLLSIPRSFMGFYVQSRNGTFTRSIKILPREKIKNVNWIQDGEIVFNQFNISKIIILQKKNIFLCIGQTKIRKKNLLVRVKVTHIACVS
jgi:hypothetical protein